jgi:hypothetical protein
VVCLGNDYHLDSSMLRWTKAAIRNWLPPSDDATLTSTLAQGAFWEPDRATEFVRRAPDYYYPTLTAGLRGVGKTVLPKHFGDVAEGEGWLVADSEWSQNDNDPSIFRRLVLEDLVRLALKL